MAAREGSKWITGGGCGSRRATQGLGQALRAWQDEERGIRTVLSTEEVVQVDQLR